MAITRCIQQFCVVLLGFSAAACVPSLADNGVGVNDDPSSNGNQSEMPAPQETARYRVTFETAWSAQTHPNEFPAGPHFSPPIGGTHNQEVRFWRVGELASPGTQRMAELGSTSPLRDEIGVHIEARNAGQIIVGGLLSPLPAVEQLTFEVSADFPLVTLVSMIAPSPDWFVGVSGLSLIDNGQWLDDLVVDLVAYDAGTDSGTTYHAANAITEPPETIHAIAQGPVLVNGEVVPLGTLRFERLDQ